MDHCSQFLFRDATEHNLNINIILILFHQNRRPDHGWLNSELPIRGGPLRQHIRHIEKIHRPRARRRNAGAQRRRQQLWRRAYRETSRNVQTRRCANGVAIVNAQSARWGSNATVGAAHTAPTVLIIPWVAPHRTAARHAPRPSKCTCGRYPSARCLRLAVRDQVRPYIFSSTGMHRSDFCLCKSHGPGASS